MGDVDLDGYKLYTIKSLSADGVNLTQSKVPVAAIKYDSCEAKA